MDKQEFTSRLRAALNGRISPATVEENINYYEDYINTEVRKGRTEEEVLRSLGDPRLIAKTIAESYEREGKSTAGESHEQEQREYGDNVYQNGSYGQNAYGNNGRRWRMPWWAWLIVVILIVMMVLSALFSILSLLLPVLLPILLVVFLVKLFRDWLN